MVVTFFQIFHIGCSLVKKKKKPKRSQIKPLGFVRFDLIGLNKSLCLARFDRGQTESKMSQTKPKAGSIWFDMTRSNQTPFGLGLTMVKPSPRGVNPEPKRGSVRFGLTGSNQTSFGLGLIVVKPRPIWVQLGLV